MIISNSATTTPVQTGDSSKPKTAPPADTTKTAAADAKPGAQGLKRLSGDAATVVLTEQGAAKTGQTPAKAPPPSPKLDLHGQDLRTVDLTKLDLRGADLTGADLTGKDLSGIDLSGATLTGAKVDGAKFSNTNLHGVTATGASFTKASFDQTDLDNGNFTEAKFTGATFDGNFQLPPTATYVYEKSYVVKNVNWSRADFSDVIFKHSMTVSHFIADDLCFRNARNEDRIEGISFTDGSMKRADFRGVIGGLWVGGADASDANFSHIVGRSIGFCRSNIDGASFHDSDTRLSFVNMSIRNADLSTKNRSFRKAYFSNCDMAGIDFSGCDFSGAKFTSDGPKIRGAYGNQSTMTPGDMVAGTDFRGANFNNASFCNMQMAKALVSDGVFRGATVFNWLGENTHIGSDSYNLGKLFRNIWPEWQANLAEMGSHTLYRECRIDVVLTDDQPAPGNPVRKISTKTADARDQIARKVLEDLRQYRARRDNDRQYTAYLTPSYRAQRWNIQGSKAPLGQTRALDPQYVARLTELSTEAALLKARHDWDTPLQQA